VPSYSRVHAVDSDGVPQVVWTVPEPSISMFSGSVTILADHVGLITGSGSKLYALGP